MKRSWMLASLLAVTCAAYLTARSVRRCGTSPPGEQARTGPTWVLHHRPGAVGQHVYDDLLAALPAGERVVLVTRDPVRPAADHPGWPRPGGAEVLVSEPLSPWARDRYVLFRRGDRLTCFARPASALPSTQWGDAAVPDLLVRAGLPVHVIRDVLAPIGGDTILTPQHALVGQYSLEQARRAGDGSDTGIEAALRRSFGRPVVFVPTYALGIERLHMDMVVAHAGDRRLVLGDPRRARAVFAGEAWTHARFGRFERRRNEAIARGVDVLAEVLAARGYRIERVPMLVGEPASPVAPPIVLTWTNVVTTGEAVLLPAYGVDALDDAAARAWRALGYTVAPIRCAESILAGGAVRCLLNRVP